MSTPSIKSTPLNYNKKIENISKNMSMRTDQKEDCYCDNAMANKFEKLWKDGQCIRSTTSSEEKITCWDGNKQYISIKPLETTYTEFKNLL
jgi:hypothetical protein